MALQKVGTSALAVMKEIDKEKRVRVKELKALDEETYTKVSISAVNLGDN